MIQSRQIQMNHVLHRTPQHRASRHETVLEDRIAPEDLSIPFRQNHRHSHALEGSHAGTLDLAADSGILYPFCTPQPDPLDTEQNPQQQDHQKLYGQKPLGHSLEHHTMWRSSPHIFVSCCILLCRQPLFSNSYLQEPVTGIYTSMMIGRIIGLRLVLA